MPAVSVVVLECADLPASLRFYTALLGVAFTTEQHGSGPIHHSATLAGVVLELYPGGEGARGMRLGLAVRNRPAAVQRLGMPPPIRDPDGRRVLLSEAEVFHYIGADHIL
ncbi:MAG: catechol 2,3-dioxygenase-like lactoylglutathione lyase family enzyme, partial [Myxococcota bacterium]